MPVFLGLDLTTWLISAGVAIFIYYWRKSTTTHYWKLKNVPTDEVKPLLGPMGDLMRGKIACVVDQEQYNKHGKVCGIYFGTSPMLLVGDPDLIKKIFVKDFQYFADRRLFPTSDDFIRSMLPNLQGEEWKRMRSIVSPVFTSGKMRKLAALINKSAESVTDSFLKLADCKTPVELKKKFGAFALDVIASTAFGTELDSIKNPDNIFGIYARRAFTTNINWRLILFAFLPGFMHKFGIPVFDPKSTSFFVDLVLKIREQRTNGRERREDFLQMLIDSEKELSEEQKEDQDDRIYGAVGEIKTHNFKKSLTREELVAQCVIFFLAGFDTTGTTLSLASYLLALNPACQERLLVEVDRTFEMHEGKMDFDIVTSMKYLDAVIAETLRLYPASPRLERRCVKEYVLGDTGITIPEGMHVAVPIYAMHRDPEFFPDPEKFKPERFLPENKDSIQHYTYMPFGSGPRNCVGMRFALMELKLALVHVLRHVSFYKIPQTEIPIQHYNSVNLLQPKSVTVGVKRRR